MEIFSNLYPIFDFCNHVLTKLSCFLRGRLNWKSNSQVLSVVLIFVDILLVASVAEYTRCFMFGILLQPKKFQQHEYTLLIVFIFVTTTIILLITICGHDRSQLHDNILLVTITFISVLLMTDVINNIYYYLFHIILRSNLCEHILLIMFMLISVLLIMITTKYYYQYLFSMMSQPEQIERFEIVIYSPCKLIKIGISDDLITNNITIKNNESMKDEYKNIIITSICNVISIISRTHQLGKYNKSCRTKDGIKINFCFLIKEESHVLRLSPLLKIINKKINCTVYIKSIL